MDLSSWIGWLLGVTVVPPMIVAAISLYLVRRYAVRLGLVDLPGGHSSHQTPTPLGGGIGVWLAVIVTFLAGTIAVAFVRESTELQAKLPSQILPYLDGIWSRVGQIWTLLCAGSVLFVLGVIDDRLGVLGKRAAKTGESLDGFFMGSRWVILRLSVQFAVAAFVVYAMGFGLTAFIGLTWLTNLLSVIWIVAVINSFNMLDNMDGLTGGVAAIIAASMAAVMLTTPDPGTARPQLFVAALLLVVCGSLLGFLWHNRPPAKIFLGDGGSYLVGFLVSVAMLMATFAGSADPRPHGVFAPLCVMAVPMYDMATVLWIRIREGRSPFQGDHSHFSHRLTDLGLSRVQAVLTIYLVTGTCGIASVLLTHVSIWQAIMVIGIVVCMLLLVVILESTGWQNEDD